MKSNYRSTLFCYARLAAAACVGVSLFVLPPRAFAQDLVVTIENLTGEGGLFLTPTWVGFHDGSFDTYTLGSPVSAGLERLAEDGATADLQSEFAATVPGGDDGVVFGTSGVGGPVDPGEVAMQSFSVNPANRYFSYASMVIPSNDAFISNGNPLAHEIYDAAGNFLGPISFVVLGSAVVDAGTEENTELEAAFINQTGPDMGDTTVGGVASLHPGFIGSLGNPSGTPIILGGTTAAGTTVDPAVADFTLAGFQLARITVSQIPEPTGLALAGLGLMLCGVGRRMR